MKRRTCVFMLNLKLQFEEKIKYVKDKSKAFKEKFPDETQLLIEAIPVYVSSLLIYFHVPGGSLYYPTFGLMFAGYSLYNKRQQVKECFQSHEVDDRDDETDGE